jgi:lysophospholipase L1-like esterase
MKGNRTVLLQNNDHVLFYGDSITDAGRRDKSNNHGLGYGYPALIAAALGSRLADMRLRFTNQGISGNRVHDLETRLQADVIDLKPTVVSILIGINDTWRRYDKGVLSPIGDFLESYRRICRTIVEKAGSRLVICEPFLLPTPEDRRQWREDLNPRIQAVRDVAREFAARFIPLDGLFHSAVSRREMAYWLPDGVHPSVAGHGLIADAWIDAVL